MNLVVEGTSLGKLLTVFYNLFIKRMTLVFQLNLGSFSSNLSFLIRSKFLTYKVYCLVV